ncbi:MAG: hypothetical protein K2G37_00605 [Clostridia bacterium]|nr:hypothetical protein [Clostridia bacterium]MDE7328470.1 hypothetical protein [Clostridia bacterium]
MKKKSCVLAVAVALCIVLIFSMVACGGVTNEVQEYKDILEKVVTTYYNKYNAEADSVGLSLMSAAKAVTYPQGVFEALQGASDKEEIDDQDNYESMAIDGLLSIYAYIDSFGEIYGSEKLYDITMYMPSYESEAGFTTQAAYVTIESKGNHKIAYMYGGGNDECFYVFDIEFINDSTFSITMLTIVNIDGKLENMYYVYTDTDGRFVFYVPYEGGAIYSDGSKGYVVDDESAIAKCDSEVKPLFDAVDLDAMRAYEDKTDHPVTREQYQASLEKLQEKLKEQAKAE